MEFNVFRFRHAGNRRCGDKLGVKALGKRPQRRENALHVDHNGLACAGQNHVFLLQEVARHGDAVTHGYLVGGAADARDIDTLGALRLGKRDEFRIIRVEYDHFRQAGIMAVDDDVDHVFFHDAQIRGGLNGLGGAEQNVGELRAHHASFWLIFLPVFGIIYQMVLLTILEMCFQKK